jgi:peptidyl-dipeptidase A
LNRLFHGRDLVAIARAYTGALEFDLESVVRRSDLFERVDKDQHAFCIDIDREGDVRVLANLRDDLASMDTLLHELGHAAYDVHIPRALPWWLRGPAHMCTTEAVALWMGRAPREPQWLATWAGADRDEAARLAAGARRTQQLQMLLAVRWMTVMVHFERAFYGDPTSDDLDTLWWDLVEELQDVRRPEARRAPDWAAKIHLTTAPVYYHNYLLGELASAQLEAALSRELDDARDRLTRPAPTGAFLKTRIFAPGSTLHWQDLLREATGRPLSTDTFVAEFAAD